MKHETGTREWSEHSFNCVRGCAHGCLYCYARGLRFNPKRGADWEREELDSPKVIKKPGVVMFPTRHDFTAKTAGHSLDYLNMLLRVGNNVLVVTKSAAAAQEIVRVLTDYPKDQSELRFTITHNNFEVGRLWEPNAPPVSSRLLALHWANASGVRTSVSCEPWLDTFDSLIRFVNDIADSQVETIWIGHANKLESRTKWLAGRPDVAKAVAAIIAQQTPEQAKRVYLALKDNPKVRWKAEFAETLQRAGIKV